ncbi:hypothetical protein GQ457_10G012070 [Hibiscus cannabinus]
MKWTDNPIVAPIIFQGVVRYCKDMCEKFGWKLVFNFRVSKCDAHKLAKQGSVRNVNAMWFCNEGTNGL